MNKIHDKYKIGLNVGLLLGNNLFQQFHILFFYENFYRADSSNKCRSSFVNPPFTP